MAHGGNLVRLFAHYVCEVVRTPLNSMFSVKILLMFSAQKATKHSEQKQAWRVILGQKIVPEAFRTTFRKLGSKKVVLFGHGCFWRGTLWEPFWHQNLIKMLSNNC